MATPQPPNPYWPQPPRGGGGGHPTVPWAPPIPFPTTMPFGPLGLAPGVGQSLAAMAMLPQGDPAALPPGTCIGGWCGMGAGAGSGVEDTQSLSSSPFDYLRPGTPLLGFPSGAFVNLRPGRWPPPIKRPQHWDDWLKIY